jgi:hypothetical protein
MPTQTPQLDQSASSAAAGAGAGRAQSSSTLAAQSSTTGNEAAGSISSGGAEVGSGVAGIGADDMDSDVDDDSELAIAKTAAAKVLARFSAELALAIIVRAPGRAVLDGAAPDDAELERTPHEILPDEHVELSGNSYSVERALQDVLPFEQLKAKRVRYRDKGRGGRKFQFFNTASFTTALAATIRELPQSGEVYNSVQLQFLQELSKSRAKSKRTARLQMCKKTIPDGRWGHSPHSAGTTRISIEVKNVAVLNGHAYFPSSALCVCSTCAVISKSASSQGSKATRAAHNLEHQKERASRLQHFTKLVDAVVALGAAPMNKEQIEYVPSLSFPRL